LRGEDKGKRHDLATEEYTKALAEYSQGSQQRLDFIIQPVDSAAKVGFYQPADFDSSATKTVCNRLCLYYMQQLKEVTLR